MISIYPGSYIVRAIEFGHITMLQMFTLAKAPSPQRKIYETIFFPGTKNTCHLCVPGAFARTMTYTAEEQEDVR